MSHQLIVIGASFGGLSALPILLADLPRDFPAAIVFVQHRGKQADDGMLEFLRKASRLPIREPEDKDLIAPGCVYLAPRDYHLLVEKGWFALSLEAPVRYARPSIDLLFESAAEAYREQVVGMVLTGANDDGARGLARIKARGGMTIVQEPASAEIASMPQAALLASPVDRILPLPQIALLLNELCPLIAR
jgi:two-component system chemotaxis response regulator CheB